MEQQNQPWQKPELTVLVRNKPEEAVLSACKQYPMDGPQGCDWACENSYDECTHLGCEVMSAS